MSCKKTALWIFFICGAFLTPTFANPDQGLSIKLPPYSRIEMEKSPGELVFPFTVKIFGPLGGVIEKTIFSSNELKPLVIRSDIIPLKDPNPKNLPFLPEICGRVILEPAETLSVSPRAVYDGTDDLLNHFPVFQLLEPDSYGIHNQETHVLLSNKSYSHMDGLNVLLLKSVELKYDYEDSGIIDYVGPDPVNGKEVAIHEGDGGFYANIHYAIVPYDKKILSFDRQTLLHFAQGKLMEIDRLDLSPLIKTHSLIPGPFLSKREGTYAPCEWGDTAYQAPVQKMDYQNIALWDWDYPIEKNDRLLMIVWEGDEEEWLIKQKRIDPFYLTDDLIGIFEIKKRKTRKPLTLINEKGDFKMTLQTGDVSQ